MQVGIVLEGPDCCGKSTVAKAIKDIVEYIGGDCSIQHATNLIPSDFSTLIPFSHDDQIKVIEQCRRHIINGAHPFQLFDFIVFDRICPISDHVYNDSFDEPFELYESQRKLMNLVIQYRKQVQFFQLYRPNTLDVWKGRVEQGLELVTDEDKFVQILNRYRMISIELMNVVYTVENSGTPEATAINIIMRTLIEVLK